MRKIQFDSTSRNLSEALGLSKKREDFISDIVSKFFASSSKKDEIDASGVLKEIIETVETEEELMFATWYAARAYADCIDIIKERKKKIDLAHKQLFTIFNDNKL